MKALLRVGTVLLALSMMLLPQIGLRAAEEKEAIPTDRLLPPDVSVYLSIPSVDDLKARFGKTSLGQMSEDSAFEPFKAELTKGFEHVSGEIEQNLGVTLKELLQVPSGEFAIAVITPPGKKISGVMFLDFGDSEKTVNALMEKADKGLEENGATSDDEEINGTKVTAWTLKKDADSDEKPNQLVYFIKDTMLVLSSDLETAKAVLTRWDGKHSDTFADNDNYNLVLKKCSSEDNDELLVWFVNPMGLVQAAMTQMAAANPQIGLAMGFMEPLGINGVKAIGGTFDMAAEDFDSSSKTFLMIEQPTKGLLNVFQFPAIEQTPPRWVTTNASAWFSLNWDIGGAYKAIETMVDMFQGPGRTAGMIDQLAQQEPNIHLKKDVIDVISGRIQFVMESAKKKSEKEGQDRVVVAVGLKDGKKFKATMAKIAKAPGFPAKAREFQGATIYEFDIPDFSGSGEPKSGGLAINADQILFSNDVTAVEAMLRGDTDGDALVESAEYKQIAAHIPAKTSIVSYSKQDSQIETLWDAARNGQFGSAFPDIDFSKLPEYDAVKKYLQPSGSYTVPDKKGVLFVSFSTKGKKK